MGFNARRTKMAPSQMNQAPVDSLVVEEQDRFFNTQQLNSDLKGHSVRGGAVMMAAQGMKFCLSIGSTAVLARLLTPQDYGLIPSSPLKNSPGGEGLAGMV